MSSLSWRNRGVRRGLVAVALTGEPAPLEELTKDQVRSSASQFLSLDQVKAIARHTEAATGDLVLMIAGPPKIANLALSFLRNEMGGRLGLADPNLLAFAFVVDFPLFQWSEEEERWDATHHPFTLPKEGDEQYVEGDPGRVIARCYDLVCNGEELASGSIRVHNRELQERIFKTLGYTLEQMEARFGQLLTALEYGAPPPRGHSSGH